MMNNFNKKILTESEVIEFSGALKHSLRCDFRQILSVVIYEFRQCLGLGLYEKLCENLVDDGNVPEWNAQTSYQEGDFIKYKNKLYQAIKDTDKQPPLNTDWRKARKFKKDCLNVLWCDWGLAEYLSHKVIISIFPDLVIRTGPSGAYKEQGQDFTSISVEEANLKVKSHHRRAAVALGNFDHFIRMSEDTDCFEGYKPLIVNCCDNCGKSKDKDCTCKGKDIVHSQRRKARYRVAK